MIAIQYSITLPADYDMAIIRERVATRGHLLDELPGLAIKAYCVQERGVAGAEVNRYAPFYLWRDTDAMIGFLRAGFRGVVESFGRPVVEQWVAVATHDALTALTPPSYALRTDTAIPPDAAPHAAIEAALSEHATLASTPGVAFAELALDTRSWTLTRFSLWTTVPVDVRGTTYRVLHVSKP